MKTVIREKNPKEEIQEFLHHILEIKDTIEESGEPLQSLKAACMDCFETLKSLILRLFRASQLRYLPVVHNKDLTV